MIKSLNIEKFKGFLSNGPKIKDLKSGINVVYGENGAGKTTICKAIKALLWPETFKDLSSKVSAVWQDGNKGEVFSNLQQSSVTWTKEGKSNQKDYNLNVPKEFSSCFVISTDFFDISNDNTDKNIYDLISKELSGGINFREIKNSKELEFSSKKLKNLKKELNKSIQKRKEIESEASILKNEEETLPTIRKQISEKKELLKAENQLENLIRKKEIEETISKYEKDIANLRQGAISMKEDDVSNLEKYEKKISSLTNNINLKENELKNFLDQKNNLEQERILSKEEIKDFDLIKGELDKTQRRLDSVKQEEKILKEKKEGFIKVLESPSAYYRLKSYEKFKIEKLTSFAKDFKELNEKKKGLLLALQELEENSEEAINKQKKDYKDILTLYKIKMKGFISQILLAAFFIFMILSFAKLQNFKALSITLFVLSIISTFVFYKLAKKKEEAFDNSTYNINLSSLSEVSSLKKQLKAKRDASLRRKINKDQPFTIKQKINEMEDEIAKLISENKVYYDRLFEPILNNGCDILQLWSDIKKNEENQIELDNNSKSIVERKSHLLDKAKKFFIKDDFDSDLIFISRSLEKERERTDAFNLLLTKIDYLEKEIKEANSQINEYKDDINEILTRVNLTPNKKNDIYLIFEDRKSYINLKDEIKSLNIELKNIEAKILDNKQFSNLSKKELNDEKSKIEDKLSLLEGVEKKEIEITTRIKAFNNSSSLISARKDELKNKKQIDNFINDSYVKLAGESILNYVENEYKKEKEPAILIEANRLFSIFTNGKYSLKFFDKDSSLIGFMAFNEEEQKIYSLQELSLGTKAQLILALRCAYVLSFSKSKNLPILVDEVLATTDDNRFDAIMNSFFKLAKEGYQIIYFTSQQSVIAKINNLGALNQMDVNIQTISKLNLEDYNKYYDNIGVLKIPNLQNTKIKDRLKTLKAAPLSFPLNKENVHIAYLEDDPQVLHNLLKLGITSFGQLNNLYEKVTNKNYIISKDKMEKIRQKASALELYSKLWKIGRGEKFSEEFLNNNSSDTFKTKLVEIAKDANWMSQEFMNKISPENSENKIPRFNQQYNKIKEAFEKTSLIDERDVLPKEKLNTEFISEFCNLYPNANKDEVLDWLSFVMGNVN